MKQSQVIFKTLVIGLLLSNLIISPLIALANPIGLHQDNVSVVVPTFEKALTPDQILERDTQAGNHKQGTAMFAGFSLDTQLSPVLDGTMIIKDGNTQVWRMLIVSPGALQTGLVFERFSLGDGEKLFVYTPNLSVVHGPYDSNDNVASGILATPITPGDSLVVEFHAPTTNGILHRNHPLRLASVLHIVQGGQSDDQSFLKGIGAAGSCNVNINCIEGQNWQRQKRGIARMLMPVGAELFYCTGTLINNTRNNGAMLFLTAEHCGTGATPQNLTQWQFYFNFERPGCDNTGIVPSHFLLTGAEILASAWLTNGSDFKLLRLTQTAPRDWNLFWNGWDRREYPSNSGVVIHHPGGDVKKISTYWEPTTPITPNFGGQIMATNSAWRVVWAPTTTNQGVTEGGSSGSPLFNSDGLVIGTLAGGQATCNHRNLPDFFGRFSHHWNRNGTHPTISLASHLDPLNTGVEVLGGFDPNLPTHIQNPAETAPEIASMHFVQESNFINMRFTKSISQAQVAIFNASGNLIKSEDLGQVQANTVRTISTHGLRPGMYLAKINAQQGVSVLKFIVVR